MWSETNIGGSNERAIPKGNQSPRGVVVISVKAYEMGAGVTPLSGFFLSMSDVEAHFKTMQMIR